MRDENYPIYDLNEIGDNYHVFNFKQIGNEASFANKQSREAEFVRLLHGIGFTYYDERSYCNLNLINPPNFFENNVKMYVYGRPDGLLCEGNINTKQNEAKAKTSTNIFEDDEDEDFVMDDDDGDDGDYDDEKKVSNYVAQIEAGEAYGVVSEKRARQFDAIESILNSVRVVLQYKSYKNKNEGKEKRKGSDANSSSSKSTNLNERWQLFGYFVSICMLARHKKPIIGVGTSMNDMESCVVVYYDGCRKKVVIKACTAYFAINAVKAALDGDNLGSLLKNISCYKFQSSADLSLQRWVCLSYHFVVCLSFVCRVC